MRTLSIGEFAVLARRFVVDFASPREPNRRRGPSHVEDCAIEARQTDTGQDGMSECEVISVRTLDFILEEFYGLRSFGGDKAMSALRKTFVAIVAVAAGLVIGLVISSGGGLSPELEAAPPSSSIEAVAMPSWADVADRIVPAVVNVSSERVVKINRRGDEGPFTTPEDFFRDFFRRGTPEEGKQRSLGSGFIIDSEGYILTNNHVALSADAKIMVKLSDETEYKAEIVGTDPDTDLALLKIDPEDELPVLKLGNSSGLRVGDWVMAVGNPLGFDRTVTVGVVSALGRSNLRFGTNSPAYQDYIQTDASINFGNSGGPLVDARGRVIGVNSAISTPSGGNVGIGFAIPIDIAAGVIDQLLE